MLHIELEKPHQKLTFIYNNNKHHSKNYTPHYLMLGDMLYSRPWRNERLPIDLISHTSNP